MTPPLPPRTSEAYPTAPERAAFDTGVLYGMQGAAEVLEGMAADQLEAGAIESAAWIKEAADGLRAAVDARAPH